MDFLLVFTSTFRKNCILIDHQSCVEIDSQLTETDTPNSQYVIKSSS